MTGSFGGFCIGAALGGFGAAELLVQTSIFVPMPAELKSVSPKLRESYRKAYLEQMRSIRRKNIYGGAVGMAFLAGGGLFLLVF